MHLVGRSSDQSVVAPQGIAYKNLCNTTQRCGDEPSCLGKMGKGASCRYGLDLDEAREVVLADLLGE